MTCWFRGPEQQGELCKMKDVVANEKKNVEGGGRGGRVLPLRVNPCACNVEVQFSNWDGHAIRA
jgi:hypothetical protein